MMYITAFMSVASGKPFHIPVHIDVQCVKSAEAIVNTSYSHAEVFTSISKKNYCKVFDVWFSLFFIILTE